MPGVEYVCGGKYHCVTKQGVPQSTGRLQDGEKDEAAANLPRAHSISLLQTIPPLLRFFQHLCPRWVLEPLGLCPVLVIAVCLRFSCPFPFNFILPPVCFHKCPPVCQIDLQIFSLIARVPYRGMQVLKSVVRPNSPGHSWHTGPLWSAECRKSTSWYEQISKRCPFLPTVTATLSPRVQQAW